MNRLYNAAIRLYGLAARLSAPAVPKARAWVKGRRNWRAELQEVFPQQKPVVWVHCASLGEFEQGRPVIEGIREKWPEAFILLSFFSPSGYEIRKNYEYADHVCYMPLDTPRNARDFVDIVRPDLAIFVKYEFWLNHLASLFGRQVPVVLVSALFRPSQPFFKKLGRNFRDALLRYEHVFVQDEYSAELLAGIGMDRVSVAGDTRIDRVLEMAGEMEGVPALEAFSADDPVFIFGSIWQQDEIVLRPFIQQHLDQYRFVIAPHETQKATVDRYCSIFEQHFIKLSNIRKYDPDNHRVLIVDSVGQLASMYRYAQMAFVGGAFGHGLHNILEPVAFKIPVFFGPRYDNFIEAIHLADRQLAFPVESYDEFLEKWNEMQDTAARARLADQLEDWLEQSRGATEKVMSYLRDSGHIKASGVDGEE